MTEQAKGVDIRRRVKEILRRDLKMGPDVRIDDEMPLFSSEADLDSLDMLLLVASIEREFGFRIPNEAVGQAIFQNVDTLAAYIQDHGEAVSKSSIREVSPPTSPLDRLPHGEEFRFVSKIKRLVLEESVEGVWILNGSEPFFAAHFPGRPIVPGVLIAEALAQISGLIEPHTDGQQGMLAQVDLRFEQPVVPPAEIVLRSQLNVGLGAIRQFQVSAEVNGITVAHGKIALYLSADGAR